MTDAELQKMMDEARVAETKLASGEISTLGQKATTPVTQTPASAQQPIYTPNLVSMRTPTGTVATVDVNSDAYKQNIGGQFSGYTPATVEAPAATPEAASILSTQNKATETFADQSGAGLQKVTVTPTETKTEKVMTDTEKKIEEATKASETNVFESDLDKAYQRIQSGIASEIDKTNVARAIQQGKFTPSSPIKDVSTQQKITSYIGSTQYAKLKSAYTPFQLASATYKDANGDIFFKPGYGESSMNSIPREDPQKTSDNITEKVVKAVGDGISEGEKKKDTYTKEVPELETKNQSVSVETKNTTLFDAATKVNKAKKKVDDFNAQIDQLKKDIKKEVEGEASESYITALASVRGEDILKQLKLAQNDYDYALNEYNAMKIDQDTQNTIDLNLLTNGYAKLESIAGLKPEQYITINGSNYKIPVGGADNQVVSNDNGIFLVNKDTGTIKTLQSSTKEGDLSKYTAEDVKIAGFSASYQNSINNLNKLGDNFVPNEKDQKSIDQYINKSIIEGIPFIGGLATIQKTDLYKNLSDVGKQYFQAAMEGTMAKLRKESGAAITPSEVRDYMTTYMPRYGDDTVTLQQKKDARTLALNGLISGSRGAYSALYNVTTPTTGSSDSIDWNW